MALTGLPELTIKIKLASNSDSPVSCLRLPQTEIRGISYYIQKEYKFFFSFSSKCKAETGPWMFV